MAVIDCRGWTVPSAGAWQTTKPTGTQVWNVVVNGAEKLKTARTISLTGDVTGSASFDGSANASITATVANDSHSHSNSTITSLDASKISSGTLASTRLPSSGVTAGSYGPTANVTGTNGTTINVPQITVDKYGRVTSVTNRVYTSKDTNTTYSLSSFGITASAAELNKLDGCTATTTELNYVDGVTSNIQTQLNNKAASSHSHSYLPLAGGTMTGNITLRTISGSWIQGKTSAPIIAGGASSTSGTAYYPIIMGKTDAGDVWNLGHGANDQVGFWGFYNERTSNGSDWGHWIKVSDGTVHLTKNVYHEGGYAQYLYGGYSYYYNTNIPSITNASSATAANGTSRIFWRANNGNSMGELLTGIEANNNLFMRMEAVRQNGSETYYNTLSLKLGPTGQYLYSITSPASFRNSLGLGNTSGALPVANGGTGATARGGSITSSGLLYKIGVQAGTGAAPSSGSAGMIYIQYS